MRLYRCDVCGRLIELTDNRQVTRVFTLDVCMDCYRASQRLDPDRLREIYIHKIKEEIAKNEQKT